jgi:localization factor PodJL
MARNDHSEAPGAEDPPAKDLTDDVKRLLDQLAGQITDADQRHSESVQDMQVRLAALSDRAAAAKPDLPDDCAEVLGRVETAMGALADRLADAKPNAPAADEAPTVLPEEVRADLRRAIANGHREGQIAAATPQLKRGPAAAGPSDQPTPARYPYVGPHSAAQPVAPPAAPAIERAWLEDRFADIADRVEKSMSRLDRHNSFEAISARFDQLEQRFAVALDAAPARGGPDAGALQGIEKQITGLFAELDRTRTQLGRLDTIESRLTELRGAPSDEKMTRLADAATPTDAQLSAVAMAAAECVAERIRGMTQTVAAPSDAAPSAAASDPRLGELIGVMQAFISEHRTGDAETAEALDTMQQAMQHLIDRVEAIEGAQITGHDELMRAAQGLQPRRTGGRHEPLAPAGAIGAEELPSIAVIGPAGPPPADDEFQRDPRRALPALDLEDDARRLAAAHDSTAAPAAARAHLTPPTGASAAAGEPHREAFIAMARRAAAKAAREPSPDADTAPAADPTAGPFGWVRHLAAYRPADGAAGPVRRPRILLVASIAAFLLAGFWMLAGSGLRGVIPGIGHAQPASPTTSTGMNRIAPADNAVSRPAPSSEPPGSKFPGLGRVVDGGYGITIDERPGRTAATAPSLKVSEPVQLASLPAPTAQDEAQKVAAMPERPGARSGPVEMPSAKVGPLSLRQAAANGDRAAQFEVGLRFAEAKGVPQDFGQAATWYQRAATQGLANAQYRLGQLYDRGLGVAADPGRARVWYGRAAEQGNVRAMHNLAVFSASRTDSAPDYPSAVQWFTEAATRGLADSQYNLGILYETGRGVPASLVEAYKWHALAARSGDKEAIRRRDVLRNKLEPASVNAVDTLVIKWRAQPLDPAANDMHSAILATQETR